MAEAPYTGRCLCGAVAWESPGPPLFAGLCHCESCRRISGAPFVGRLGLASETLTLRGEIREYRSSARATWTRCAKCGAPLTYRNETYPEDVHLNAASLDDPARFEPTQHFHWEERVPWAEYQHGLEIYESHGT